MKKTTSIGMVLAYTLVGVVLVGDRIVILANAQEETALADTNLVSSADTNLVSSADTNLVSSTDTNLVSSTDTNFPPVNTLLGSSLPQDIDPASPLGQLVRLIQAGVEKNVILAYIQTSPRFFELDADGIIYLTDLGTPSEVIEAVMDHDQKLFEEGVQANEPQPDESAIVVDEEPPEVTVNEFYDTLSPYGSWVYIEGYGRCWRPTVVVYNANWRPYCDNGRWVYTDCGWYWASNYSWGWATFHYGRWFRHTRYGWCWWPDTVWAPSWVCWRYDNDYCGWAPLPPHTACRSGVGIVYRGSTVGVGFSFNLNYDCYTFVSIRNFCNPYPRRYCVERDRIRHIYDRTRTDCRYDFDRKSRIINRGLPVDHFSTVSNQKISPVSIRYASRKSATNAGNETLDRNRRTLVVNRHDVATNTRPSVQRSSPSRQNVTRVNPRSQEDPGPSARSVNPRPATRSDVNRQSTPSRANNRGSVTTPRQSTPRTTSTPSANVSRRPPATQRNITVPPSRPSTSRQSSTGSNHGSQRSTQVRQQRPSPSVTPPRNSRVQQNNSSRTKQTSEAANNGRSGTTPQVNTSRRPSTVTPRVAPPARASRSRNADDNRQ